MALRDRRLATLALFAGLAVAHTWPLALDPGTWSRNDHADAQLNAWILAWVPHALRTQPLRLFDANIFHPDRLTLAYSEHLFVPALMGAPLAWSGASPVLVHNLLVLGGLALTGWAWWLLGWRWTGDWWAGLVTGCLAAFNAHTLTRLAHVQALHVAFLPLALLALDGLVRRPGVGRGLALGTWFSLQALCSGYLMAMSLLAVGAGLAVRAREWLTPRPTRGFILGMLAAGLLALVICGPFLWPYARVRAEQGLSRSLDEVALYSADPSDYLTTAGRLHYGWWSHRWYRGRDALFPGGLALLLTAVAVGSGTAWRDGRARMVLAMVVVGIALSFGPRLPGYRALHEWMPLLQGLRGAARFGYLGLAGIAVLAGVGLARLRGVWLTPSSRAGTLLALGAAIIVNAEAWRAPIAYTPFEGIPRAYDALAPLPGAVIAEFPFPAPEHVARNAPYVLASTRHWRPLVNGYSGFVPSSYLRIASQVQDFPSPTSLDALAQVGVTHVVVHGEAASHLVAACNAQARLRRLVQGRISIYELVP